MERWPKQKSYRPSKNSSYSLSKIYLYNAQRDLPFSLPSMRKAISFLLQELRITTDEVSFHFVTERKICELHKEFFNDPTPTDCITFPLDALEEKKGSFHILGEAFICPRTALLYSKTHKMDPFQELYRYVIHCLLHLIGYTDTDPQQRAKMKRKENAYLKKIIQEGFLKYTRRD